MRLIDADRLKQEITIGMSDDDTSYAADAARNVIRMFCELIDEQPTVNVLKIPTNDRELLDYIKAGKGLPPLRRNEVAGK